MLSLAERFPAQLSGGQQQRVAIARSLVLEPRILMFDEPLSNLDFKLRIQMRDELKSLQRRLGKTAIYVTHDQTEALALSDRIAVLSHGHIEQIGTPDEIYERPATSFVAEFIGSSNLLPAKIVERGERELTVETERGLRLRSADDGNLAGDGAEVIFGLQNEREWATFCGEVRRRPELACDPRFASNSQRVEHRAELDTRKNPEFLGTGR